MAHLPVELQDPTVRNLGLEPSDRLQEPEPEAALSSKYRWVQELLPKRVKVLGRLVTPQSIVKCALVLCEKSLPCPSWPANLPGSCSPFAAEVPAYLLALAYPWALAFRLFLELRALMVVIAYWEQQVQKPCWQAEQDEGWVERCRWHEALWACQL